jgi:hypothetical protein
MIEGSGSIPLTNGSGSGSRRPKNMWRDPVDPDPVDPDPVDPDPDSDPQYWFQ